jgi:hypothetical protein
MRLPLAAGVGLLGIFVAACDGTIDGLPLGSDAQGTNGETPASGGTTTVTGGATATGSGGTLPGSTSSAGGSGGTTVGVGGANVGTAGNGGISGGVSGVGGTVSVDPTLPVVELYQHCSYGGWQAGLPVGDYTSAALAALGAINADASSLQVAAGFEVVLFDGDEFTGSAITIGADTDCLVGVSFNDRAVSLKVRVASDGTGGSSGEGGTSGTSGSSGEGGTSGSGTAGTSSGGTGNNGDDHYQACVDRINGFRATKGLPALARRTDKEACADGQAKSDSETGTAHGSFNQCDDWAQNECPGWGSIDDVIENCIQMMWDEGPGGGHYENMIGNRTQVWCGFYTTPAGKVWSVQDFK